MSEIYAIGKGVFNLKNEAIADVLEDWKSTPHDSYLLDITIDILRFRESGEPLLEQILDIAGHKGTGLWTVTEALELGVPIPTISSAMNERILSGKKVLREMLSPSPSEGTLPRWRGLGGGFSNVAPEQSTPSPSQRGRCIEGLFWSLKN